MRSEPLRSLVRARACVRARVFVEKGALVTKYTLAGAARLPATLLRRKTVEAPQTLETTSQLAFIKPMTEIPQYNKASLSFALARPPARSLRV